MTAYINSNFIKIRKSHENQISFNSFSKYNFRGKQKLLFLYRFVYKNMMVMSDTGFQ